MKTEIHSKVKGILQALDIGQTEEDVGGTISLENRDNSKLKQKHVVGGKPNADSPDKRNIDMVPVSKMLGTMFN